MSIPALPALALLIAVAPGATAKTAAKPDCEKVAAITATAPGDGVIVSNLGQEPPARQIKAVDRSIDGCRKPIEVRAEVGATRR